MADFVDYRAHEHTPRADGDFLSSPESSDVRPASGNGQESFNFGRGKNVTALWTSNSSYWLPTVYGVRSKRRSNNIS